MLNASLGTKAPSLGRRRVRQRVGGGWEANSLADTMKPWRSPCSSDLQGDGTGVDGGCGCNVHPPRKRQRSLLKLIRRGPVTFEKISSAWKLSARKP